MLKLVGQWLAFSNEHDYIIDINAYDDDWNRHAKNNYMKIDAAITVVNDDDDE